MRDRGQRRCRCAVRRVGWPSPGVAETWGERCCHVAALQPRLLLGCCSRKDRHSRAQIRAVGMHAGLAGAGQMLGRRGRDRGPEPGRGREWAGGGPAWQRCLRWGLQRFSHSHAPSQESTQPCPVTRLTISCAQECLNACSRDGWTTHYLAVAHDSADSSTSSCHHSRQHTRMLTPASPLSRSHLRPAASRPRSSGPPAAPSAPPAAPIAAAPAPTSAPRGSA